MRRVGRRRRSTSALQYLSVHNDYALQFITFRIDKCHNLGSWSVPYLSIANTTFFMVFTGLDVLYVLCMVTLQNKTVGLLFADCLLNWWADLTGILGIFQLSSLPRSHTDGGPYLSPQDIIRTTKQKLSLQKFLKKLQNITNISADTTTRAFANAKAKVLANNKEKVLPKPRQNLLQASQQNFLQTSQQKFFQTLRQKFKERLWFAKISRLKSAETACQNIAADVCSNIAAEDRYLAAKVHSATKVNTQF